MEDAKVNEFATQLQIVQYRVNYYYAKGQDVYKDFGTSIVETTEELQTKIQNAINAVGLDSSAGYKYYDEDDLKELGVEEVNIPIIINFQTRDVIGINGVKKDGIMHYRLEELGKSYNIKYEGPTDNAEPTFSLEKKVNGLNATLTISDITYNGTMKKGTVYFGQVIDGTTNPVTVNYWQETSDSNININNSGTYAVKVVDGLGNEATATIEIILTNAPKLAEGMVLTNQYDYATDNWATAEKEGTTYVWVPRYSYRGPNIKYLRGTLNIPTDNNVETDYETNSFFTSDGEEITGIWVKYIPNIIETIKSNPGISKEELETETVTSIIIVK